MQIFNKKDLKKLYRPAFDSSGEDNGQVTIIGGSELFHGAPLLALKIASRIDDMVFFATPEKSVGQIAETIKSKLFSFIWVPWEEVEFYIQKSDACLIGPGFMRFKTEHSANLPAGRQGITAQSSLDEVGNLSREITERLLRKFPEKKWVIDAGSLQVIDPELLPRDSIITPNIKEFELLFGCKKIVASSLENKPATSYLLQATKYAKQFNCTIVLKGPETLVVSSKDSVLVKGGNPGMTKGGTGDILAGLTVALLAKNDPFSAACAASYIEKAAADALYQKVGVNYNADDLVNQIPETLQLLTK